MRLTATNHTGALYDLTGASGSSLKRLINDAWLEEIFGIFGGAGESAPCHVIIDEDFFIQLGLPKQVDGEPRRGRNFPLGPPRLSYQIVVNNDVDGLRITIAREG